MAIVGERDCSWWDIYLQKMSMASSAVVSADICDPFLHDLKYYFYFLFSRL